MAYGSVAGVAVLAHRYTSGGTFDVTTNPPASAVTAWLGEVSSMVNLALASRGFATPITDADVTPAIDGFVNAMAADLVHAANSTGRFYSERALENGVSPIKVINNDVIAWVDSMAHGLELLGASRSAQAVNVVSSVSNPQYLRVVVEDNSITDWGEVI